MTRRTRNGRCRVSGQSAWVSYRMLGWSGNSATSAPARIRSRISQTAALDHLAAGPFGKLVIDV